AKIHARLLPATRRRLSRSAGTGRLPTPTPSRRSVGCLRRTIRQSPPPFDYQIWRQVAAIGIIQRLLPCRICWGSPSFSQKHRSEARAHLVRRAHLEAVEANPVDTRRRGWLNYLYTHLRPELADFTSSARLVPSIHNPRCPIKTGGTPRALVGFRGRGDYSMTGRESPGSRSCRCARHGAMPFVITRSWNC